jgi:hypothetical protein
MKVDEKTSLSEPVRLVSTGATSSSLIFTLQDCVLAHLAHSRSPKLFRTQFVTESFDLTVAPLAKILFAEEKLAGKLYRKFWFELIRVTHG